MEIVKMRHLLDPQLIPTESQHTFLLVAQIAAEILLEYLQVFFHFETGLSQAIAP